ncbi:hypothetical protein BC567DRAFT_276195 [Phyllosticta citribraziliensis]
MSSTNPANSLPEGMAEKLAGSDVEPPKDWSQYGFPQFLKDNLASLGATRPTMAQAELLAMLGQADFDSFVTTQLEGEGGSTLGICLSAILTAYRRIDGRRRCVDQTGKLIQPAGPESKARDRSRPILPASIILCPTTDAAENMHRMLQSLTHPGCLYLGTIIDGKKREDTVLQFEYDCDIIVATPAELISIVEDKDLIIKSPRSFILDEVHWLLGSYFEWPLEKLYHLRVISSTTSLGFVCKFYTEAIHKDVLAFRDRSELPLITTTFAHDPVPNLERQLTGEFEYMEEVPSYHNCGKNWYADYSSANSGWW